MQSGDNPPIFDLIFERIEDTSLLSSFICGIKKLDDFIHHGLQTYIETIPCETYLVFMERKLVALLTLKEDQLILDDDDKDDKNVYVESIDEETLAEQIKVFAEDGTYFRSGQTAGQIQGRFAWRRDRYRQKCFKGPFLKRWG